MDIKKKRQKEIKIVTLMIQLYCRYHCDIDEQELIQYASSKIQKCPMMEKKTFCSKCPIHCYQKEMQEKIKRVMRYSGPRMIFYHPILAIKHMLDK